ncbi:MAG: magnesium transporter CorA family protein [Pseudomonadota bacterium]|nr:magnesium transporter CorA family protein [Pseudomonadota bacterium]
MLRMFGPDCLPTPADAEALKAIPAGVKWIDLLNPTKQEEKLAEVALGQNIPTREELDEIEPSSRLYLRKGALFLTASVIYGVNKGKPDTDPIGFILTDKLLVTVRYVDPLPFIRFIEHLCAEPEQAQEPLSILVRLLDVIVDRLADELERAARDIEALSSQVFKHRSKVGSRKTEVRLEALLLRIGEVQRLLSEIRESALSTARLLSFLGTSKLCRDSDQFASLESLHGDVRALLDHNGFLTDNLGFLMSASLGLITLEQNFVMKVFSVFAVVLMPPTLIAGIYGMNFDHMPELRWLLGYPFALALILVSAVVPYWIARRSGWL